MKTYFCVRLCGPFCFCDGRISSREGSSSDLRASSVLITEAAFWSVLKMASGGSDRRPQFTSSHYEIPSWQVPWSKPWYQCVASEGPKKQNKYNSRGHDVNCNCTGCEEDLETAFTPQVSNTTADILNIPVNMTETEINPEAQQESPETCEKKTTFGNRKVLLLSELPEVKPKEDSSPAGPAQANETSNPSPAEPASSSSFPSVQSVMGSVGSISALATISDRTKNIQARVEQLSDDSSVQEFVILRGLLLSCVAQLNRIDSAEVRWLEMAKNMSLEAIRTLLAQLEEKLKGRVDLDQD